MQNQGLQPSNYSPLYRIFLLRFVGNTLIFLAAFFVVKTFIGPVGAELRYFVDSRILQNTYAMSESLISPDTGEILPEEKGGSGKNSGVTPESQLASFFKINTRTFVAPVDTSYSIFIPKIAANAKIIKNVNPSDEDEYLEKLKYGVAHASGTGFPGDGGNIFLFAHSTDYIWNVSNYNAVFYLLYKLEEGDEIDIIYEGKRYVYITTGKKVVSPSEVEYLTNTTSEEMLTLQTCWPPGTTLQRLLVFAKRKAI